MSYALTARQHIPEVKADPLTEEALLFLQKVSSETEQKKAPPITPLQVQQALSRSPPEIATSMTLMWISAARHADLRPGKLVSCHGIADGWWEVVISFGVWKSDRSGTRAASKALVVNDAILIQLRDRQYAPFQTIKDWLKKVDSQLTVHSFRRGAINWLAEDHTPEEIATLTQHASGQSVSGTHKYLVPTTKGPMAQKQLQLCSKLWSAISSRSSTLPPPTAHGGGTQRTTKEKSRSKGEVRKKGLDRGAKHL